MKTITKEQSQALNELRQAGYAVIIWAPEELGEVSPRRVEERSIELGHQIIEDLKD